MSPQIARAFGVLLLLAVPAIAPRYAAAMASPVGVGTSTGSPLPGLEMSSTPVDSIAMSVTPNFNSHSFSFITCSVNVRYSRSRHCPGFPSGGNTHTANFSL